MKTFVVDASVAAKWLLPWAGETLIPEAEALFEFYSREQIQLLAPDLFWAEIGNVAWKAAIRGRISARDAERAVEKSLQFGFPSIPTLSLAPAAMSIALNHKRSVYDSIYVAAAVTASAELVTADEKLVNALGARFPVRWLGALRNLFV
jgi:predicted nucleic acid-binding protein